MATHELEITEPVDLCTSDGLRPNPHGLGWSRVPLHRANLDGYFGRNKKWDYWAILAGDLLISATFADLDTFCLIDLGWINCTEGTSGGKSTIAAHGAFVMPEHPSTTTISVDLDGLQLTIADLTDVTEFSASWTEADGTPGKLSARVEKPNGLESLNVVIPWADELFNFTSKHWCRPSSGTLTLGDRVHAFGLAHGEEAFGVLDVGRGRWPAKLNWNWGGGAGNSNGRLIGLQFGAKWTDGSGLTENGFLIDGRLTKIGSDLEWTYDWDNPMEPWRVVDPKGQLDVTLTPTYDKHSKIEVTEDLGSETHQVYGYWSGMVRTDDGEIITVDRIYGFAEEARQRW